MNNRERDLAILNLANSINTLFDKNNFQLDEDDYDCLWNEIKIHSTKEQFNGFIKYREVLKKQGYFN